jgi:ATP-dependent Clp protease ATP-binding subunit ClpC
MEQADTEKLLKMESELRGKVVGQNEAVVAVAKALRRSRADLKDPRRPIGSFIFLGPTGVGKTYLAQTLAEYMFGDRDALIQFDMSEYREEHTISRLVGSPPGYVGHEEGGQLSEQVRRRPYSVVLFDEIEKAHPNVLHLLLQVLEEGKLTDALGRKIDFRNTIIILTTNIGAEAMKKASLGFGGEKEDASYDSMKAKVLTEAKRSLKPEFINRFDDLIVFHQLTKPDLQFIVDLEVAKLVERLRQKEVKIVLDDKARDFLIEKGFDPAYGARPMRRAVERYLEDPMAEELLKGTVKPGDTAQVSTDEKGLTFSASKSAGAPEAATAS